ncbi:MAG: hypothetical protein KIT31_19900 [Deltaproteobacteria bacterium]|nr:hypothetical protein [Deltaproteobacteria bacterium]
MADGKHGGNVVIVLGALVVVGGALAYFLLIQPRIDRHRMVHQQGEPRGSLVAGDVVAVYDHVSIDHEDRDDPARNRTDAATRVTTFDARSGARLAQELIEGLDGCAAASPERVWCAVATQGSELGLYDARTYKRVRAFGDLVQEARLGKLVPGRWRVDGATAVHMLDDGRVAVVDGAAATPTARREDAVPPALRDQGPLAMAPSKGSIPMASDCGAHAAMAGDLMRTGKDRPARTVLRGQGPRARVAQAGSASADTYLSPVWVPGEAPLLLHHTSLDADGDRTQLSRLGPDGTAAWTTELARGCEQVATIGKLVVVTTKDPRRRVVAVDLDSGAVRYAAGF